MRCCCSRWETMAVGRGDRHRRRARRAPAPALADADRLRAAGWSSRACSSSPRRTTRSACADCATARSLVLRRSPRASSSRSTTCRSIDGHARRPAAHSELFGLAARSTRRSTSSSPSTTPEGQAAADAREQERLDGAARPARRHARCSADAARAADARGRRRLPRARDRRSPTTRKRVDLQDETRKKRIAARWAEAAPMIRVQSPARAGVAAARSRGRADAIERRSAQDEPAGRSLQRVQERRVRKALNAAFRFKCAYCESFFGATQPVAVEHYRPKAQGHDATHGETRAITGSPRPRGTTCCPPAPTATARASRRSAGEARDDRQGEQVPDRDRERRARATGRGEQRSSGSCCTRTSTTPSGTSSSSTRGSCVTPESRGRHSPQGPCSIDVYALQRPGLVKAREALQIRDPGADRRSCGARPRASTPTRHDARSGGRSSSEELAGAAALLMTASSPTRRWRGS